MTQYSGVYSLTTQGQALTSGQWATDPYYKNTTLLLHADGVANGAQNNTFLDSSTNAFAITRNGNTTQGSFTPYGPTWSNYFTPSTASIDFPTTSNLNLPGNFTIDFWFNLSSIPATGYIFSGTAFTIQFVTSNLICYDGAANQTILTAPSANTWYYISLVRSGSVVTPYVNGVAGAPFVNTSATVFTHSAGRLGAAISSGASPITGYLSNYRVSNIARTISLPTTPPTQDASTLALVCASNRFNDLGINNLTLTVGSGVSVQRFSPFAPQYQYTPAVIGGSGYFGGTGDYLSIANSSATQLGTTYTVEGWFYTSTTTNQRYFGKYSSGVGGWVLLGTSTELIWYFASDGAYYISATVSVPMGSWNHIAIATNGSTMRFWLNGASVGTYSSPPATQDDGGATQIGSYNGSVGTTFSGYVSDFRIVNGSDVYGVSNSTITVPTTPLTAVTNTSLLCSMTNAGIYDNAMMNDLQTVGNAQVSTSVVKYGSGSMYFDGSGDYLVNAASPNLTLGSGDFTLECWINPSSVSGTPIIVDSYDGASTGWQLYINSSVVKFYSGTASLLAGTTVLSTGTWYHVAVSRSGTSIKLFLNGVSEASTTSSAAYTNASNPLWIAAQRAAGPQGYYTGYIDDFRITKGVARYTGNFIPPKVAMPNQ